VCCVGSGIRDALINRSKIPAVCDLETSTLMRFGPDFGCCAKEKQRKRSIQSSLKYFMFVVLGK
jgi:hypothetical protein